MSAAAPGNSLLVNYPQNVTATAEAFFFPNERGVPLLGVWRTPAEKFSSSAQSPRWVWVICPPFAEEEKSARRTLVELTQGLAEGGDFHGFNQDVPCGISSLFFSYEGTGDSDGDFREASLSGWRGDVRAACAEVRRRAPEARITLCGLRLGASLAIAEAASSGANDCVLIEPVLQGKSLLTAIAQKKRLRAMITKTEAASTESGSSHTASAVPSELPDDDFDGWPISLKLKEELEAFDLTRDFPKFDGAVSVYQVGPRENVSPALKEWHQRFHNPEILEAVRMPAFWNALDYARADALFAALESVI